MADELSRTSQGLRRLPETGIDQVTMERLNLLPPEKREELLTKLVTDGFQVDQELRMRQFKSRNGEHDLAVGLENLRNLEASKKVYTFDQNAQLGSGDVKVKVKGGDINFLLPVLVVIGVVILGLALIFSSK